MINRSKKESPQAWEKWRKAGSVESHPDDLEAKGFTRAEFKLDPPDQFHNNYQLHFSSIEMSNETREAYKTATRKLAKGLDSKVFFQSGVLPEDTWHMFEFWGEKDSEKILAIVDSIHEKAREIFKRDLQ